MTAHEHSATMAEAAIRWAEERARIRIVAVAAATAVLAPRLEGALRRLSDAWSSPKLLGCAPDWQAERSSYMLTAQDKDAEHLYEVRG